MGKKAAIKLNKIYLIYQRNYSKLKIAQTAKNQSKKAQGATIWLVSSVNINSAGSVVKDIAILILKDGIYVDAQVLNMQAGLQVKNVYTLYPYSSFTWYYL